MPRQDVPYGGAICRLKERIAEIWDKLDEKLHSINGVEGDGAGNVEIASGDAAVVINNDQIGHRIEVSLDSSKLPAASVSSVNGQTGAVRLDAADVPSDGNSNIQADIAANKAAINDCFDSITTEQDDRHDADAALQTNINAVKASIPEMSTTPDPYKGVERDAQGRALAADPASGAVDQSLVTANWASQSGDSAPNNLAHRNGNETWNGVKRIGAGNIGKMSIAYKTSTQTDTWFKMLEGSRANWGKFAMVLIMDTNNNNAAIVKIGGFGSDATNYWCGPVVKNTFPMANVRLTIDTNNKLALWVKPRLSNTPVFVTVLLEGQSLTTGAFSSWLMAMGEPNLPEAEPVVGSTYTVVYTPSDVTS